METGLGLRDSIINMQPAVLSRGLIVALLPFGKVECGNIFGEDDMKKRILFVNWMEVWRPPVRPVYA